MSEFDPFAPAEPLHAGGGDNSFEHEREDLYRRLIGGFVRFYKGLPKMHRREIQTRLEEVFDVAKDLAPYVHVFPGSVPDFFC